MSWVLVENFSEKKSKLKQVKESKFSYREYLSQAYFSLFTLSCKIFLVQCLYCAINLSERVLWKGLLEVWRNGMCNQKK